MTNSFYRMATIVGLALTALIAVALLWMAAKPEAQTIGAGPIGTLHSAMLANGQVYYGKLEEVGRGYLTLSDVYYVTSVQDPQGNRTNRLINRRIADWHAPLRMSIPMEKILMLEQVGADSTVAKGIEQERRTPAPAQAPQPPQAPQAPLPTPAQ